MKKCCNNCVHFHSCLGEEESFYHIHDYCDVWDRTNTAPMYSVINSFLDDYFVDFDASNVNYINDDNETGESCCYRFDAVEKQDEHFDDNWLKQNFDHNRDLALKLADKIILEGKCYNRILDKEEELDAEDLKYFRGLRKKIMATKWEENNDGDVHSK